jgi:Flp pilus assembly pilin Flp
MNSTVAQEDSKEAVGTTMIEYALMALLIAAACVAAVTYLGVSTSSSFSTVGSGFGF